VKADVTFVIAAYNAETSIERAIESALAQTDVNVEVVVVDDRSTDQTVSRALGVASDRVRVVSTEWNCGPAGARNVGFDLARGCWIAILDADDCLQPGRTARMIARAEQANAEIVVDNLEVTHEEAGAENMFAPDDLERRRVLTLHDFIAANQLFRSRFTFGYMKPMFRRNFVFEHNLRYDETLRIGEDYIFLASALASGARCVIDPFAGYIYHVRKGSISRILEQHHVAAMIDADARFIGQFELDREEKLAQRLRTKSLNRAAAYLSLIESIKRRSVIGAVRTAVGSPGVIRLLSMPLSARFRRLVRFEPDRKVVAR
jgi:succinoglycan biosynthesis protein ExoO